MDTGNPKYENELARMGNHFLAQSCRYALLLLNTPPSLFFLVQIENSIPREPKIQPTQLKQRSMSGNQEIMQTPPSLRNQSSSLGSILSAK